ncbi:TVA4 protein, partial [Dromaius novaehollandiae]|nr:TVA4 protein [Dromaius novaehollandiae]
SFLVVAAGRAQVRQEPLAEATAGISITCSHPNIQTSNLIHWYWQLPGRDPMFITSIFKESKEVWDPPGTLLVAADRRSSALQLARPHWWDTAVYYCAVGD